MRKIRLENGVTMIVLIITIIVLLILAGVSINFALQDTSFSIERKQLSELKMVSHAIYEQYTKYKKTGTEEFLIGTDNFSDNVTISEDMNGNNLTSSIEINSSSNNGKAKEEQWLKLNKDDLKKIGIEEVSNDEYIVKYSTGAAYNITAKKSKRSGKTLYTSLEQ